MLDADEVTITRCIACIHDSYILLLHSLLVWSRDSIVGIVTGYRLDDLGFGVQVLVGSRIFSSPIQWVHEALSLGIKQPGHEADHSPSASAEVKKMCIYTSTPP
jgi:hypothetical protein